MVMPMATETKTSQTWWRERSRTPTPTRPLWRRRVRVRSSLAVRGGGSAGVLVEPVVTGGVRSGRASAVGGRCGARVWSSVLPLRAVVRNGREQLHTMGEDDLALCGTNRFCAALL